MKFSKLHAFIFIYYFHLSLGKIIDLNVQAPTLTCIGEGAHGAREEKKMMSHWREENYLNIIVQCRYRYTK